MKKRKLIGACGNFHINKSFLNGQVIRSTSIINELSAVIGSDQIEALSYHNWRRNPFSLLFHFVFLIKNCQNVILFPDSRAIHVLLPLAVFMKGLFRTKVFYNVIGGWLVDYVAENRKRIKRLNKLDGLFVQTTQLLNTLTDTGVKNVVLFPNFKRIKVYTPSELPDVRNKPYKLVFMSRIVGEKGVTQLVKTIQKINEGRVVPLFTLDLYGSVQHGYEEEFKHLMADAPSYICFRGKVDPLKTSDTMKNYFLHVFPTLLKTTEGFPGSVLDAFCGGCPTLAARWYSFHDVIHEGKDGLGFEMGNWDDLEQKLIWAADHPDSIIAMREKCLARGEEYRPERMIHIMLEKMAIKQEAGKSYGLQKDSIKTKPGR